MHLQIQQGLNTYGGLKRHARVQEVHNHDGLWHYIITIKFIICLFKIYVRTHLLTLLTFIYFTLFLESLFNLHNMHTNRHMSNKFKFVKKLSSLPIFFKQKICPLRTILPKSNHFKQINKKEKVDTDLIQTITLPFWAFTLFHLNNEREREHTAGDIKQQQPVRKVKSFNFWKDYMPKKKHFVFMHWAISADCRFHSECCVFILTQQTSTCENYWHTYTHTHT